MQPSAVLLTSVGRSLQKVHEVNATVLGPQVKSPKLRLCIVYLTTLSQ
jgi:hypothetical protein